MVWRAVTAGAGGSYSIGMAREALGEGCHLNWALESGQGLVKRRCGDQEEHSWGGHHDEDTRWKRAGAEEMLRSKAGKVGQATHRALRCLNITL